MAWHRVITNNLSWKLVSVLLATLVWLLIHYSTSDRLRGGPLRVFEALPVHVVAPPGDSDARRVEPPVVRLTVRGPAAALEELNSRDLVAFVNLVGTRETAGVHEVEIHTPAGVSVAAVAPIQVRVHRLPANPSSAP